MEPYVRLANCGERSAKIALKMRVEHKSIEHGRWKNVVRQRYAAAVKYQTAGKLITAFISQGMPASLSLPGCCHRA
jgi:hypothetical protein